MNWGERNLPSHLGLWGPGSLSDEPRSPRFSSLLVWASGKLGEYGSVSGASRALDVIGDSELKGSVSQFKRDDKVVAAGLKQAAPLRPELRGSSLLLQQHVMRR